MEDGRFRKKAAHTFLQYKKMRSPAKDNTFLTEPKKPTIYSSGFVARIRVKGCGRDQVVSFSCDEKENRLPHPQLERV